jgi:hypothetical protein
MKLISVECLPVPAARAVVKALQARLGCAVVQDDDTGRCATPLAALLHRLRAIGRQRHDVLLAGSWLLRVPDDPLTRDLHRDLGRALAHKLVGERVTHVLLCLRACPDEAFEALIQGEHLKDLTLEQVRQWAGDIDGAVEDAAAAAATPFEDVRVVALDCPAFAGDNPVTLEALVDRICAALTMA